MIYIYNLSLIILGLTLSPIILIIFLLKSKFRAGFFQKIGFYPEFKKNESAKQRILVHAVSVGEVNAVENFIKTIKTEHPEFEIILTTTTRTGQEVANNKLSNIVDKILYFPYDFSFSVNSFLNAIKPDKIIIAETEIWPGFTFCAYTKNIPLYIINGRISPKSHKGYKKIKFFLTNILAKYTKILMQSDGDSERIIDIGAPSEKVSTMGNLKFDIEKMLTQTEVDELNKQLKLAENVLFVAASTHKGEDEIALDTYINTCKIIPNLKFLLAPRHPQRFAQVEELIKKTGLEYGKQSSGDNFSDKDIIMLDTMGELSKLFSLAKVALIGGSFSNTGGHNPLEANIWGVPVISGPTVFNFKDIYKLLTQNKAAFIVKNKNELQALLLKLLQDNDFYNTAKADAENIFEVSRGALQKAIREIFDY